MNIENAYQGMQPGAEYRPFDGIVLTDTFQMSEEGDPMDTVFFPRNNDRADRQKGLDIRVIVSNPPWSSGQTSQNDDNQNMSYPTLDASIRSTYAERSNATNKNSLYDSYIRGIRWASNRLAESPAGGVIGFVTNGGWIDGNSAAGIRRHADARVPPHLRLQPSGEPAHQRRSVTPRRWQGLRQRQPCHRGDHAARETAGPVPDGGGTISYHDIGDYLSRDEKLAAVAAASIDGLPWQRITPNEHHDWLNQRDVRYDRLVPLAGESRGDFSYRVARAGNISRHLGLQLVRGRAAYQRRRDDRFL